MCIKNFNIKVIYKIILYNVTSEGVEMPDIDELNSKTAKFQ